MTYLLDAVPFSCEFERIQLQQRSTFAAGAFHFNLRVDRKPAGLVNAMDTFSDRKDIISLMHISQGE